MKNLFFLQKMYSKNDLRIKFYQKKIKNLKNKGNKNMEKEYNLEKNGNFCFF